MSHEKELSLNEIVLLIAQSQSSEMLRPDTGMIFMALDNIEVTNRRLKNIGRFPDRRKKK